VDGVVVNMLKCWFGLLYSAMEVLRYVKLVSALLLSMWDATAARVKWRVPVENVRWRFG
jgi:hypothetical protein